MKVLKGVLTVVIYIVLVVVLLIPVSYLLRPLEDDNKEVRERITGFYAEQEDSLDIVTVGSSAFFRYINTPYLWEQEGLTSWNFAIHDLNVRLMGDLIDEIHKTQSPELLIVDMRKFIRDKSTTKMTEASKARAALALNNLKYSPLRCRMINKIYDDPKDRISCCFDIAMYHDGWENVTLENFKYIDNEEEHALKGYHIIDVVEPFEPVDVSEEKGEVAISEDAEMALRELLEKCKKEDLQVLFLTTPWSNTLKEQKKSNYIGNIIEEYGYQYLDMNPIKDELGLDYSTDFYNIKHVNVYGSEKVTAYLGEYISENYEFTRQHCDEVVASWDEAVNEYDRQMEERKKKGE